MFPVFEFYKNRVLVLKLPIFIIGLILPILFIYQDIYSFDFINLDDDAYIVTNIYVQQGMNWESVKWAWTSFSDPYYMPLTWMSYLIDSKIYGIDSTGFHFSNLLLHASCVIILFLFLYKLTHKKIESYFVSLLFAIHPQRVESVVWLAERKELLAAFFGLLALLFYVEHVRNCQKAIQQNCYKNKSAYLLVIMFYIFTLLSKPVWITLPFVLLLLDVWPMQRFKTQSLLELIYEKSPMFLIMLVFFVIHILIVTKTGVEINPYKDIPLIQRIENIPVIYIEYLIKSIFPFNFTGYRQYPLIPISSAYIWFSITVLSIITLISVLIFHIKPYVLVGWFWFVGTLVPVLGVLGVGESIFIGDRWTYLPHIGLNVIYIWLFISIYKRHKKYKYLLSFIFSLLLFSFAFSSYTHTSYWRNSETLWKQVIKNDGNSDVAQYMLGKYYAEQGNMNEAHTYFYNAHNINQDNPIYLIDLGNVLINLHDNENAWNYYNKLIDIPDVHSTLLLNVGILAINHNKLLSARKMFIKVINIKNPRKTSNSNIHDAHLYLGFLYLLNNEIDNAEHVFKMYLSQPTEAKCNNYLKVFETFKKTHRLIYDGQSYSLYCK